MATRPYTFGGRRSWSPIQFAYAAKPWWKFEHLQRFNRILMPVCQRFYPVEADVAPPADIDALARWMERWGLLPGDMPRAVAQHQLEALTSRPVETVEAEGIPDTTTSQILRLPAEWEPSEAVVITWPVLSPGFWGFYRDLVAAIAPAARVDVLIPHAIYAPAVLAYLGKGWHDDRRLRLLVTASDDVWIRYYGPLTCIDKVGQRVMVDAIFDPPPTPFANDDSFPVRYAAHQGCLGRHLALHLEGGNLWSDPTIVTMDAAAMTFPDGSFDCVFSHSCFEHLSEPGDVIRHVARVLRPGGLAHVDAHLYTSDSGCHDVRIFSGRRESIPSWAHLRPQCRHLVQPVEAGTAWLQLVILSL